jgi:hypothetical protein
VHPLPGTAVIAMEMRFTVTYAHFDGVQRKARWCAQQLAQLHGHALRVEAAAGEPMPSDAFRRASAPWGNRAAA